MLFEMKREHGRQDRRSWLRYIDLNLGKQSRCDPLTIVTNYFEEIEGRLDLYMILGQWAAYKLFFRFEFREYHILNLYRQAIFWNFRKNLKGR